MQRMKKAGLTVQKHILDNEASKEFKAVIESYGIKHELVPPHRHRRNIAEKGIQTAKNHFESILCGIADNFPMQL